MYQYIMVKSLSSQTFAELLLGPPSWLWPNVFGLMFEGELSKRQMSRVGVRTMMRMVGVHVEDHAAWSGDQMGWEMDGMSENHVGPCGQVGL